MAIAIDGALPREVRTLEQLLAGRGRKQQVAIAWLLSATQALIDESKNSDTE